jgi:hypothetical protein
VAGLSAQHSLALVLAIFTGLVGGLLLITHQVLGKWHTASMDAWTVDLAAAFSPKVVPLDVDVDGLYSESATRWGLHPAYAAVPLDVRDAAEALLPADVADHLRELRTHPVGTASWPLRSTPRSRPPAELVPS